MFPTVLETKPTSSAQWLLYGRSDIQDKVLEEPVTKVTLPLQQLLVNMKNNIVVRRILWKKMKNMEGLSAQLPKNWTALAVKRSRLDVH